MEKLQNQKEKEKDFFDNIETFSLSKNDFITKMRELDPNSSDEEILQMRAINTNLDGKVVVIICKDLFPEKYLPYIEIHEKWEAYIARKDGHNLYKKAVREYTESKNISSLEEGNSRQEFYGELSKNNYEFRHEYAVFREFKKALEDGNLEEYYNWFLQSREKEMSETDDQGKIFLENDSIIRESIYNKLTKGEKHYFTRKN